MTPTATFSIPDPLTDEQVEQAARELCRLRGLDPEEQIVTGAPPQPGGWIPAISVYHPRWQLAAGEVRVADRIRRAIASVVPRGG